MKPAALLVTVALVASGSVVVTHLLAPSDQVVDGELAELSGDVAQLSAAVAEMQQTQAALDATLKRLQLGLTARPQADAVSLGEIASVVESVLAGRESDAALLAELGDELTDEAAEDGEERYTVETALLAIANSTGGDLERELVWQRIRDQGLMDDVIAAFEKMAEEDPYNAELRTAVGVAYLQKIQEIGSGPLAGVWATKADGAFDEALAIDETNWDARFTKAVALSFWPPVFGKQNEAIQHFETLIGQQEGGPVESRHAQTYLLLGNIYQQVGKPEKARDIWVEGLDLFPDDEALSGQLMASK